MTRINVGIPPAELTDKHLLAEHREIKRIPNCIAKGKYNMEGIPDKFKLGKGHVKFFYNKLEYLLLNISPLYSKFDKVIDEDEILYLRFSISIDSFKEGKSFKSGRNSIVSKSYCK